MLDESTAKTNLTRLYGRALVAERCNEFSAHGHWATTTMISVIRCAGAIEEATLFIDRPINSETFLGYIAKCLAPELSLDDVVVLDNLGAHKVVGVEETIERVGASVWYLPPYSPDLNPIEKVWSKIKSWLRGAADTFAGLIHAAGHAFRAVTSLEGADYIAACGEGI